MKRRRQPLLLPDLNSDLLFTLIQFLSFWDIFYFIKTCLKTYSFGKEERTVNFLTERLFKELAPNKRGLFEWVINLLNLQHKEYLHTLLGREIIFSEFLPNKSGCNPIISIGPFTKCKHAIILLCLIRSFKPTEISVTINLPTLQQEFKNQKREYARKRTFLSVLLAIVDHLKIEYTWPNPINNSRLISEIIIGSLEYEPNIENTINKYLRKDT